MKRIASKNLKNDFPFSDRLAIRKGNNLLERSTDLAKVASEASAQAVAESKALGLAITFIEDYLVIKQMADGKRQILRRLTKENNLSKLKLKKGVKFSLNGPA